MRRNKWDWAKCVALGLPPLFLAAYLLGAALPVPGFLLPERRYLALGRESGAAELAAARGTAREAFAVLVDRLHPLPPAGSPLAAYEKAAALLPDRPSLGPVLADLEFGLPDFRRAGIVMEGLPSPAEAAALSAVALRKGLPLGFEGAPGSGAALVASLSYRIAPAEGRRSFELLFAPAAREAALLEVSVRGGESLRPVTLWRGPGRDLPPDRILRLSAEAKALGRGLRVAAALGPGADTPSAVLDLDLGVEATERERVLVVTAKGPDKRSFVERLYPAVRAAPEAAAALDLRSYELITLDGLAIGGLPAALRDGLLEVARSGTGSLLFVADSPDFGKRGDDPELEALLPVTLLPRSVKDLPDLAILLLIDVSGSMFGDKLSLAKVTGLELLKNLKPGDRVGMLLFSDERRWVYEFQPNSSIVAAPLLEPVRAKGGTDLAAALSEGLDRLAGLGLKERHVVLVTDGVTKPADFQALADRARAIGATVSAMGVGEDANRALLERLAFRAGGRYYRVKDADEIPGLLFEDRKSAARPPFDQGAIRILALNGAPVATIGGMAQYAAAEPATVLFANELGDPLFASRERGNRAVMLFASDLYGTYTGEFFANPEAAGAVKDRLDALFAERPLEVAVLESRRGAALSVASDALVAPRLLLSRAGAAPVELPFERAGPASWTVRATLPVDGRWHASILDRGAALVAFPLAANPGLAGEEARSELALRGWRPRAARPLRSPALWLCLFFASSLAATVVLRIKR